MPYRQRTERSVPGPGDAVPMSQASASPAILRVIALLDAARRPVSPRQRDGYLDLLGDEDATGAHPGQRWMASRTLPLIYERAWRPLGGLVLMGPGGPGDAR